jgi:hypothetical protein
MVANILEVWPPPKENKNGTKQIPKEKQKKRRRATIKFELRYQA